MQIKNYRYEVNGEKKCLKHEFFDQRDFVTLSNPHLRNYVTFKGKRPAYKEIWEKMGGWKGHNPWSGVVKFATELAWGVIMRRMIEENETLFLPNYSALRIEAMKERSTDPKYLPTHGVIYSISARTPSAVYAGIDIVNFIGEPLGKYKERFEDLVYNQGKQYATWE